MQPDYARVHYELRRKGMTLMLLWEEYQAEHADRHTYRYSQYCEKYRQFAKRFKRSAFAELRTDTVCEPGSLAMRKCGRFEMRMPGRFSVQKGG